MTEESAISIEKKDICDLSITDVFCFNPEGNKNEVSKGNKEFSEIVTKAQELVNSLTPIQKGMLDNLASKIINIFSTELSISSVIEYIENRIEISDEVKEVFAKNNELLDVVANVVDNLYQNQKNNYTLSAICIGYDPEIPDWKPLELHLLINSDNPKERINLRHDIMKIAFHNLNSKFKNKIFIIDI